MMKACACILLLAVLADSAPQFFYQEVPLPDEAPSHRRLRSYEYVALYPGDFAYSGAAGLANAGFYPYGYHPYGGSSAASSAAAYGGRNGLAPYGGAASAASAAQTHGYRGGAAAASAAAAGGYY